jgi:hypothetical protein
VAALAATAIDMYRDSRSTRRRPSSLSTLDNYS